MATSGSRRRVTSDERFVTQCDHATVVDPVAARRAKHPRCRSQRRCRTLALPDKGATQVTAARYPREHDGRSRACVHRGRACRRRRRSRLRRVSRAFPTGRDHSWSAAINRRCRAGGWSADPCAFPDDPNVARPRLEPIHGCGELARWRLGRPALANASNVAAALEVLEPSKRLVAVHACRTGGHRRGERARQLGQRGS